MSGSNDANQWEIVNVDGFRMMSRRRLQTLALVLFFLVNLIGPAAASGPQYQPRSDSKKKCDALGFDVYQKWQKPVGLFPFYQDCKIGYVDTRGRVVVPPQFEYGGSFYEQLAVVGVKINEKVKYGFINQRGQFVIDPEFDTAHPFSEGMAGVRLGNQRGYIDRKGAVVIPPRFAEVTDFYRGLARVRMFNEKGHHGKWGCINKKGEFVVQPQYDHIQHFTERIIIAGLNSNNGQWKWGLISWTGETIREPQFDLIGSFDDKVAMVRLAGHRGLINSTGQLIGNQKYNEALTNFSEGLIAVRVDNQVGYLNRRGEWAIRPQFNSGRAFSEGLAAVKIGEKFGYINKAGRVVIKPQFDEAIEFSEGLATVKIEWRYGFIDREGVIRIPPRFNSVTSFRGGAALARTWDSEGYINRNGEFIRRWPPADIEGFPLRLISPLKDVPPAPKRPYR